jgi:hypothetical protein
VTTPPGGENCINGIDDDGDGLVDGLVELNLNNGQTATFGHGDPFFLRSQLRNEIAAKRFPLSNIGDDAILRSDGYWPGSGDSPHTPTLNKVCNVFGYSSVRSHTCATQLPSFCNYDSPEDNYLWRFNGVDFVRESASPETGKSWISSITCVNRLPACSDGWDNDNDGLIDVQDPGCASSTDDSEVGHDPECPVECSDGIDNDGDGKIDFDGDGQAIATHLGSTFPGSEGWSVTGDGTVQSVGNAILTRDSSTQNPGGPRPVIVRNLNSDEESRAEGMGWTFTASMKPVSSSRSEAFPAIYMAYNDGTYPYLITFSAHGGDAVVLLPSSFDQRAGYSGQRVVVPGGAFTFHNYSLDYNPSAQTITLSVDGTERARLSGYTGVPIVQNGRLVSQGGPQAVWGHGSDPDTGEAHWQFVQFKIRAGMPDPQCVNSTDPSERN